MLTSLKMYTVSNWPILRDQIWDSVEIAARDLADHVDGPVLDRIWDATPQWEIEDLIKDSLRVNMEWLV